MKILRNITTITILALIVANQMLLSAQIPVTFAQTGGFNGNGGEVLCRNGSRDWGNFISSVISYNGFIEYWNDILYRYNKNMCLYLDIDNLLKRIDKIREQIRKAFYVCDTSATKLRDTYYELEAELFFLREYVAFDNNGTMFFVSEKKISNDFIEYFVTQKGFFTKDKALLLLQKFSSKYAARQQAYIECNDPSWTNLVQKWNEFKTNVGGLAAVKEAGETITKQWNNAINTPFQRTGNLLGGLIDAKINGLDPKTAWSDIAAELSKNTPSGYTFDQFNAATAADNERANAELDRAVYLAQYQQLYQEGSGTIVNEIVDRVKYLQNTINSTYKYLEQTAQCTKGLLDKTCS